MTMADGTEMNTCSYTVKSVKLNRQTAREGMPFCTQRRERRHVAGESKMTVYRQSLLIRIPVFYSFQYAKDVVRVQQIRNIGALDENKPDSPNEWEQVKRGGNSSIKRWIDDIMKYKRCVIILVGEETSERPWVSCEIEKAWNDGKAVVGIYIHNFRCPRTGLGVRGKNLSLNHI